MPEYIDRKKLLEDISSAVVFTVRPDRPSAELRGANKIMDRIMAAPVADVVEVVKCRNCKHLSENRFFCKYYNIAIIDNGFCYRGTRMDGETE